MKKENLQRLLCSRTVRSSKPTDDHISVTMSSQKLIQFFKNSNLVSQTTAEEIASTFSPKEIKKNEFLFKEGKVCSEYFFLENGFIRAFAYDTEGNDVTTHFYSSGQVVFEVSSFFNRTITKENYQAIVDCERMVYYV